MVRWEVTFIANDDNPAETAIVRATAIGDDGRVANLSRVIDKAEIEQVGVTVTWLVYLKRQEILAELKEHGLL